MWGGRAPWLVLATLTSAAAAVFGAGAYLYWTPCRDQLLDGSVLAGYRLSGEFPAACLARMDAGGPLALAWRAEGEPTSDLLIAVALVTLALAWVGFVAAHRWGGAARMVAALPGILTGVLGFAILARSQGAGLAGDDWLVWLAVGIDLAALLAAGVIVQHSHGLIRLGHLVGLWGIASFGWMRTLCDYAVMVAASAANWDVPPGHGFPTALTIAVCAVASAALGLAGRTVRPRDTRLPAIAWQQTG